MGNFTTLAGIATSLGGSTTVCVTDKTENKARTKTLIGTTIASTATYAVGTTLRNSFYQDIYNERQKRAEESREAYVSSLSDEDLAAFDKALKEKEQMFAVENGATESYTKNQKTR